MIESVFGLLPLFFYLSCIRVQRVDHGVCKPLGPGLGGFDHLHQEISFSESVFPQYFPPVHTPRVSVDKKQEQGLIKIRHEREYLVEKRGLDVLRKKTIGHGDKTFSRYLEMMAGPRNYRVGSNDFSILNLSCDGSMLG